METLHFVQSDKHLLCHSEELSDEESLPGSLRNRIYEIVYLVTVIFIWINRIDKRVLFALLTHHLKGVFAVE